MKKAKLANALKAQAVAQADAAEAEAKDQYGNLSSSQRAQADKRTQASSDSRAQARETRAADRRKRAHDRARQRRQSRSEAWRRNDRERAWQQDRKRAARSDRNTSRRLEREGDKEKHGFWTTAAQKLRDSKEAVKKADDKLRAAEQDKKAAEKKLARAKRDDDIEKIFEAEVELWEAENEAEAAEAERDEAERKAEEDEKDKQWAENDGGFPCSEIDCCDPAYAKCRPECKAGEKCECVQSGDCGPFEQDSELGKGVQEEEESEEAEEEWRTEAKESEDDGGGGEEDDKEVEKRLRTVANRPPPPKPPPAKKRSTPLLPDATVPHTGFWALSTLVAQALLGAPRKRRVVRNVLDYLLEDIRRQEKAESAEREKALVAEARKLGLGHLIVKGGPTTDDYWPWGGVHKEGVFSKDPRTNKIAQQLQKKYVRLAVKAGKKYDAARAVAIALAEKFVKKHGTIFINTKTKKPVKTESQKVWGLIDISGRAKAKLKENSEAAATQDDLERLAGEVRTAVYTVIAQPLGLAGGGAATAVGRHKLAEVLAEQLATKIGEEVAESAGEAHRKR